MWKHYFKIAFRSIWSDKLYLAINIIGLTIAIACSFLFILWIRYEISFEKFYPNSDRIYQILDTEVRQDGVYKNMKLMPAIYDKLKSDYPFVEEAIYVVNNHSPLTQGEDDEGIMMDMLMSSENYFKIFPFECIAGTKKVLEQTGKGVFISDKTAKKIFGSYTNAIGKSLISFRGGPFSRTYTIDGVLKVPSNTHMQFDILALGEEEKWVLSYEPSAHYILIKKTHKLAKTNNYISEKQQRSIAEKLGEGRESKYTYVFQPLKDIHLYTDHYTQKIQYGSIYFGDYKEIRIFSVIVLLILLLAIINYVNTSTAKAITRTKEVGVRKVLGAKKKQLIIRFLAESFIISIIAVIIALDIAKIVMPAFEEIVGNPFVFRIDWITIAIALILCIVISLLAGGYAAFYLSAFNPVKVLKGGTTTGSKEYLRKTLLGIQLFLSVIILVCTLIIGRQLNYILDKDLGFDRSNIYVLDTSLWYDAETFIQELCKNPSIINATMASSTPFDVQFGHTNVEWEGSNDASKDLYIAHLACDYRFDSTFGLKMKAGTFIEPGYTWWQDTNEKSLSLVINETFEKDLGFENAIGTNITYYPYGVPAKGKIIGVVKDFHFRPLQSDISPLIIHFNPEFMIKMYIKIMPDNRRETLKHIEEKYNDFRKGSSLQDDRPFMLTSLDSVYNKMYNKEIRLGKFLVLFSILSIVLSCMGIFGMTIFIIEKRTKEIAIRKINGAKAKDIIILFGKEYGQLLGIASLFALPLAWLLMWKWLEQYTYRTTMGWWYYLEVPIIIGCIAIAIIFYLIRKAAKTNPVEALRNE